MFEGRFPMTEMTKTAAALKQVLGKTYALYLKTHSYHWNVEGPQFRSLHALFEENYRAMWESIDELAERMRAIGAYAPTAAELGEIGKVDNPDNGIPSAQMMIDNLIAGHEAWLETAAGALNTAEDMGDTATEDLLTQLIAAHEKMAWMLRSSREQ